MHCEGESEYESELRTSICVGHALVVIVNLQPEHLTEMPSNSLKGISS